MINHNRGFTVVEMMIGMTLGLILIGGVISVLMTVKSSYRVQNSIFNIQENARFILESMKKDLRVADNWGCAPSTTNLLVGGNDGYIDFLNESVFGTDGDFDTISIRRASQKANRLVASMDTPFSGVNVGTGSDITIGDIVIINDCVSGDIFQVTTDPVSADLLGHVSGGTNPGNVSDDLSKAYTDIANIYKVENFTYEVVNVDGVNWLQKTMVGQDPQLLVPFVVGFQVEYGEDTDSPLDNTPNRYVPISNVIKPDNIVSVRINLLLQSEENNVTINNVTYVFDGNAVTASDKKLYKSYVSTVTIRNRQKRS